MPGPPLDIGPLVLPVPAGTLNTAIDDPTVTGLLDYFAFWIRTNINAKLANLHGTAADAVPAANRFPQNPEKEFVRGRDDGAASPFPALYVWSQGPGKLMQYSTMRDQRQRALGLLWLFEELVYPGALVDRHGLLGAVEAAVMAGVSHRYHPSYAPPGWPAGTPITTSLRLNGFGLQVTCSQQGRMAAIPGDGAADPGKPDGHTVRAYPSLRMLLTVWEEIGQFQALDPDDVLANTNLSINVNGDGNADDPFHVDDRYLPAPDGTEFLT